ncbi:MAG: cation:proton antiporter [Clostridia bacterium]|nr:cation:proton antiporter [Clostridia bacterium]
MGAYGYLLAIALILLFTKLFGIASAKVHMPQVVGALVAGVLLGPSCLGLLEESDFLTKVSEIGVIMLMFTAGIDTDISELKKTGPAALLIATLGVFVPILGCGGAYYLFFGTGFNFQAFLNSAFVGVVFAATSVSITVETLNEMGKIKSNVGATLLAAAIIDDIIGIIVLSVLTGVSDKSVSPLLVTFKIFLFFTFTAVVGFIVYHLFKRIAIHHSHNRRIAVWALAFCLIMAYCAERFFGVADITGAYFAGVILCNLTNMRQYVAKKMTVASYLFFSPIFFAGIGLRTNLSGITVKILFFAVILFIMAVVTKVIGCGIGARLFKMSKKDSLRVGVGMVARGEVALMVAQKGITSGNINPDILPAIVLCIILAALITPILLKLSYKDKTKSAA